MSLRSSTPASTNVTARAIGSTVRWSSASTIVAASSGPHVAGRTVCPATASGRRSGNCSRNRSKPVIRAAVFRMKRARRVGLTPWFSHAHVSPKLATRTSCCGVAYAGTRSPASSADSNISTRLALAMRVRLPGSGLAVHGAQHLGNRVVEVLSSFGSGECASRHQPFAALYRANDECGRDAQGELFAQGDVRLDSSGTRLREAGRERSAVDIAVPGGSIEELGREGALCGEQSIVHLPEPSLRARALRHRRRAKR